MSAQPTSDSSLPAPECKQSVANFLHRKTEEMLYHLSYVVTLCDKALAAACGNKNAQHAHKLVVYAFSSFANLVQTLKHGASELASPAIPTVGDIHL